MIRFLFYIFFFSSSVLMAADIEVPWESGKTEPLWAKLKPTRGTIFKYVSTASAEENGRQLRNKINSLQAGDRLVISAGIYEINDWFDISLSGKPNAPIWIEAYPKAKVVLTRKDAKQNTVNIGTSKKATYLYFGGFIIKGGSTLLRMGECEQVWIDQNTIYDGSNVGIAANSNNCHEIFITKNEVYDPCRLDQKATGEGMYLGSSDGKAVMTFSVIAFNKVYRCQGVQGDGIELKNGSHSNWIYQNYVYDCNYPCITVYGTNSDKRNKIEGNLLVGSNDNAMQVQGDAYVENNIAVNGKGSAFASTDHNGKTKNLWVYQNTFVNQGTAVKLTSWDNRKDLRFYQNVVISEKNYAIDIQNHKGVLFKANLVFGKIHFSEGISKCKGIAEFNKGDFEGKNIDYRLRDARYRDKIGFDFKKNILQENLK